MKQECDLDIWRWTHVSHVLPQGFCLSPAHVSQVGILIEHPYVVIPLPMTNEIYSLHKIVTNESVGSFISICTGSFLKLKFYVDLTN